MCNKRINNIKVIGIVAVAAIAVVGTLLMKIMINSNEGYGTIIGNPNYEDSLYITRYEFEDKFNKQIEDYSFKLYDVEEKREFIYEFDENMMIRVGLRKDLKTLSFIIFKWDKDTQTKEAVSICRSLYHLFGPDETDEVINNSLIELRIIEGKIEYNEFEYSTHFMPENHVRFSSEEKEGVMKLYINDEAMGY